MSRDIFGRKTKYGQNEGKRKAAKAAEAAARQQGRNAQEQQLLTSGQATGSILSGSEAEQAGQLAGLNIANIGYGQGLAQTGQDIQGIKKKIQERTAQSGADPVSAAIMGQRAGAVANAQRNLQASGVKGAAAAGAVESIARQKDADIAASLYGQQRTSIADERSMLSNILGGTTSLMQGERAANIPQPGAPTQNSGTSFICTMLRSKGLMSAKESLIMTKFMLKSLIPRSDFFVWYFKHGKHAVERADKAGFDWSEIKKEFVDDIISLIKEGKFVEAQNLYAGRTGDFCTAFGAKGFEEKMASERFVAMFNFPRLFFIGNCQQWLKANFLNIPRILKVSI